MTWLWALGALVVYGFSTSGGMYNIIRGMPMYMIQPGGKVKWWMDVSGALGGGGGWGVAGGIWEGACTLHPLESKLNPAPLPTTDTNNPTNSNAKASLAPRGS